MKKVILALLAAAALAGCGGGSSSGTDGVGNLYTGKTTQAVVDASNAKAVSSDALDNIQQSAGVGMGGTVFKSAEGAAESSFQIQPVIGILKNCVMTVNSKPAVAKTVASTESGTQPGYSGSYSYSGTMNDTTGAVSGSITFNSYVASSGAPTISGTISLSGSVDTVSGNLKTASINMSNISVTSSSISLTMSGSISIAVTTGKETVTASIVTLDNNTKKTQYMKDLKLELTSGTSLTISGTFYNNDYGYVDISTTAPLVTSGFDSNISGGELLFTGANGTKAKMIFPGPSVYWYDGTSFALVP
jgi:hypothetical protein